MELDFALINSQLRQSSPHSDVERASLKEQTLNALRAGKVHDTQYRECAILLLQVGDVQDKGLALALATMAASRRDDDRHLIACLVDNILLGRGLPFQHFGTQYDATASEVRLRPVDPATSDTERKRFGVPAIN